jgi:HAD superfamily hydrolase (TIGR01509 family)
MALTALPLPAAVIFDMDGTLLDSESVIRELWQESMRHFGFTLSHEVHQRLLGRRLADVDATLHAHFGEAIPISLIRERVKHAYEHQAQLGQIKLKPGVHDIIDALDEFHIPRAVATSTGIQRARQMLQWSGLEFAVVTGGDEVKQGKPAPDIFLETAQRLKVTAERCWVIEDSHIGITSALAAGMHAVMVPDLMPPLPDHPWVVPNLIDIATHLRRTLSHAATIYA